MCYQLGSLEWGREKMLKTTNEGEGKEEGEGEKEEKTTRGQRSRETQAGSDNSKSCEYCRLVFFLQGFEDT